MSHDDETRPEGADPEQNEVLRTMRAHSSVRRYRPDPVPEDHVAAAVRAAQRASTSSWIQAYALLEVTDRATRARLRELTGDQAQVAESGAFFCVCGDVHRHHLLAEDAGAPNVQNLETFLLAVVDASLFAQNLALAFEALGHGVCFIGGLRNRLPDVDRLLELPDGVWPLFGLCVGAPVERPEPRPRLPLEAVWFRDRYPSDDALREEIERADVHARAYYTARGHPTRDWSGGTWRKFRRAMREDLRAYYESKGARFV